MTLRLPAGVSVVSRARASQVFAQLKGQKQIAFRYPIDGCYARAHLMELPGVGRKTAACVLLFSFGVHDVPVDTHVARVGQRLRLLRPGAPFDELHEQMLAVTPIGAELELHLNLLRHGRRTCHAQRPACPDCALRRMCPGRLR